MLDRFRRARAFLPLLALFLCVFGARLWLIQNYGNATPYWDQWDAEAATLLKPWREGRLTAADFFAPHAEHRIVFTRLETLALTALNGQWDPFVEMVVNAALAAGVAVGAAAFLGRRRPWLAPALVAAVFALPFAWENTLAGFQGQFYFLLGFTVLALHGLARCRPGSAGWWAGVVAAVAACFSMASGFTAAGVALGWLGLRLIRERRRASRGEWATAAVCVAVVVLGLVLRHDPPAHAPLKAENLAAWTRAFGRCLAWPRVREPGWAVVMWLPWAGMALTWFWQRRHGDDEDRAPVPLLLVGTWVLVQAAAMAYARGANNEPPVSRYFDLLGLGVVVNALALGWLLMTQLPPGRPLPRGMGFAAIAGWAVFLGFGVTHLLWVDFLDEMPKKRVWGQAEEVNVRAYVATGDKAHLLNKPFLHVPYPDAARLATLLDDPALRPLLPANVRAPLRFGVLADNVRDAPFLPNGLPPGGPTASDPAPGRPAIGSFLPVPNGDGAKGFGDFAASFADAPTLPYLRWETAGGPFRDDAELSLAVYDSRREKSAAVNLRALPGDRWRVEHLALPGPPGEPVGVIARDHALDAWLAFRAPTEEGQLSYWAGWLARRGTLVLAAGGLVALAAGISKLRPRARAVPAAGSTAQAVTRAGPAPSADNGR